MSRKKTDYVRSIYDGHRNNPAKNKKTILEQMYLRIFTEIACARFKWIGLPDTVDERFLEMTLFQRALAVFYYDTDFSRYLALRASGTGNINMYDNPTSYVVTGNTMLNKTLSYKSCVPIWANFIRMPDWDIAMLYSTRLAELDVTIDIDAMAMRHPFILLVDDNEKQSVINAMRQVREGQPVIVGTSALGDVLENKAKLLDMNIDKDMILNLQLAKSKIWNEAMTFLGINNANQDKRERLVVSEVSANNSQVLMARNVALNARRQAAEIINQKYELSVKVEWNIDIDTIIAEKMINENVTES